MLTDTLFPRLQEIEDLNVMHKFDRRLERLAMVMPLTDQFDPGVTGFAHKHLQVQRILLAFVRLRFRVFFQSRAFIVGAEGGREAWSRPAATSTLPRTNVDRFA